MGLTFLHVPLFHQCPYLWVWLIVTPRMALVTIGLTWWHTFLTAYALFVTHVLWDFVKRIAARKLTKTSNPGSVSRRCLTLTTCMTSRTYVVTSSGWPREKWRPLPGRSNSQFLNLYCSRPRFYEWSRQSAMPRTCDGDNKMIPGWSRRRDYRLKITYLRNRDNFRTWIWIGLRRSHSAFHSRSPTRAVTLNEATEVKMARVSGWRRQAMNPDPITSGKKPEEIW
jgi:hypothetical protein